MEQGAAEDRQSADPGEIDELRAKIAQLESQIRHLDQLAHQDSLVELPNRRGFMRELKMLIDRAGRYGEQAAMLFVDIDGLKAINDTHGHKAGDAALIHVAALLGAGVRTSDCVGRLGGDEFGILLVHVDDEQARETADRLTAQIQAQEANCDGVALPLGVAIGMTMIEADDQPDAVIGRADRAMYERKAAA